MIPPVKVRMHDGASRGVRSHEWTTAGALGSLDLTDQTRRSGASNEWTPRKIAHAAFSMENMADLSKNAGLSCARFSVLLFPHRDKERFVSTIGRGATR
jgi:hypothetical protein